MDMTIRSAPTARSASRISAAAAPRAVRVETPQPGLPHLPGQPIELAVRADQDLGEELGRHGQDALGEDVGGQGLNVQQHQLGAEESPQIDRPPQRLVRGGREVGRARDSEQYVRANPSGSIASVSPYSSTSSSSRGGTEYHTPP